MKRKIKLRDMTAEQWDKNRTSLCNLFSNGYCENCVFQCVGGCSDSFYRSSWINHKDCYSDKILDREIEIEVPDILEEEEKRYLSNIIKPFRHRVINIVKIGYNDLYFISIKIQSRFTLNKIDHIDLPLFNTDMYEGMESNKNYTLKDLGLFQKNTKITLTEFWNSKEKLAIHCNTEEKANKLLTLFDKMGKKWFSGNSYLKVNCWDEYEKDTCYSNQYGYAEIDFYKKDNYTIYEFDDVDFEELEND